MSEVQRRKSNGPSSSVLSPAFVIHIHILVHNHTTVHIAAMPVRTRSSARPTWLDTFSSMTGTAAAAGPASAEGSPVSQRNAEDVPASFRRRAHGRRVPPSGLRGTGGLAYNGIDATLRVPRPARDTCRDDPLASSPTSTNDFNYNNNNNSTPVYPTATMTTPPTSSGSTHLSSDTVLRNVAFVSVVFAIGLMFLNVALYIGVMMVGIMIPAWRTFKQLEQPVQHNIIEDVDAPITLVTSDDSDPSLRNWHKYWILTAILLTLHAFIFRPFLPSFLPTTLYHAGVMCIFSWLNSNKAANAALLYDSFVKPALARSEHMIDVCVESVLAQSDSFTRHIILAINQAVEPYARQLEHAANASRRQMEEQARRESIVDSYFD